MCIGVALSISVEASESAEQKLCEKILDMGYVIGWDGRNQRMTAVGRSLRKLSASATGQALGSVREIMHRRAELKAKANLLQMMETYGFGAESVVREKRAGAVSYQSCFVGRLFATADRIGWSVVDSVETCSEGVYDVAVAVMWSERDELAARQFRSAQLRPSAGWQTELVSWLNAQDVSSWVGTRIFVDSAGCPHQLGIGSAFCGETELQMQVGRRQADMVARKNLSLALYGDSAVREYAHRYVAEDSSTRLGENRLGNGSFFETMANVEVVNKVMDGAQPVHERFVLQPLTGRKMSMVFYGIVMQEQYQTQLKISTTHEVGGECGERAFSKKVTRNGKLKSEKRLIKVFNYATGKYEEVYK